MAEYLAALRRLASTCNFEQFFEQALRDWFVCGLANEKIKMELLQLKTPTLQGVCDKAVAMEAALKDAATMKMNAPDSEVHYSGGGERKKKEKWSAEKCYCCQRKGHLPANCQYKEAKCFKCGKEGHIAGACRTKKRASKTQKQLDDENFSSESENMLNAMDDEPVEKAMLPLTINRTVVPMEVDTGAAATIIGLDAFYAWARTKHFGCHYPRRCRRVARV